MKIPSDENNFPVRDYDLLWGFRQNPVVNNLCYRDLSHLVDEGLLEFMPSGAYMITNLGLTISP
jgi:hypothetical protein